VQNSISKKIGLIVSVTLISSLTVMMAILLTTETNSKIELVNESVENLSNILIKSIRFSMAEGINNIAPYVEKVKDTHNLQELRITPTNKIKSDSESKMDAEELAVLRTRQPKLYSETVNDQPVLRTIKPILAEEVCLTCHDSKIGEPLAIVSLRYTLSEMNAAIATQRWTTIFLALLAIGSTYFIVMYFINKNISKPIKNLTQIANKISLGSTNVTVEATTNDEIGDFERSFAMMIENIQEHAVAAEKIAQGETSVEIKVKSEEDVLSKSMIKVVETIKNLITESLMLSGAAIKGNLSTRGNAAKFSGGYRDIVNGVNETLNAVTKPIDESIIVLKQLAQGNLTVRMEGKYEGDFSEIKNNVNELASSFNNALSDVTAAVEATASASTEISSSAEEMAAGAQEQSSQTTEIASAVEEMTKTILETSQNSSKSAEAAKNAGAVAKEGGRVVDQTIEGMNRIADVVRKSAETVHALGKGSDQIGEIVQVINDIADQTNLLALNAAIEAARAGEQGRGFAVVADEVRKLAERTTKATKEIAVMIRQIQQDTSGAVDSMNKGTEEVEKGISLADKAGQSLKEIIVGVEEVMDMSTQVAAASEEQSSAAEQISKNIEAISSVTQESATGVQQIARAAEDLNRLTVNLQELTSHFILDETSGNERSSLARHPNRVLARN